MGNPPEIQRKDSEISPQGQAVLLNGVELHGHTQPVYACCVSQDGDMLLSASGDKTLKLWNLKDMCLMRDFFGHTSAVYSCALTPDGLFALSGALSGEMKVWQVSNGRESCSLTQDKEAIMCVNFSPIYSSVESASPESASSSLPELLEQHTALPLQSTFTTTYSAVCACADKTLVLWNLEVSSGESGEGHGLNVGGRSCGEEATVLLVAARDVSVACEVSSKTWGGTEREKSATEDKKRSASQAPISTSITSNLSSISLNSLGSGKKGSVCVRLHKLATLNGHRKYIFALSD
jgi:WD40 repeat protein